MDKLAALRQEPTLNVKVISCLFLINRTEARDQKKELCIKYFIIFSLGSFTFAPPTT
jgi:hypothetical protein